MYIIFFRLSDDSDNEIDNKMDFDEYENPVTQEVSLENEQEQLIEEIIGLQDVLPLLKYCQPAGIFSLKQLLLIIAYNNRQHLIPPPSL